MEILRPWLTKFGLDVIPPLPTKLDCLLVGMSASEADEVLTSWRANPQLWESLVRESRKPKPPGS